MPLSVQALGKTLKDDVEKLEKLCDIDFRSEWELDEFVVLLQDLKFHTEQLRRKVNSLIRSATSGGFSKVLTDRKLEHGERNL